MNDTRAPSPKYLVVTLLVTALFYAIGVLILQKPGRDLFLNVASPVAIIMVLGSYILYRKKGGGATATNLVPPQETLVTQPNVSYLVTGVASILFSFLPGFWVFLGIASLITFPKDNSFDLLGVLFHVIVLVVFLTLLLGGYWLVRKSEHKTGLQVVNILFLVILLLATGGAFVDLLY